MSHYIEDDRKVIRTSRGFVFMCLGGDNNVTEQKWVGGKKQWAEVRARSWCHLNHQILEATEPEIMDFVQRVYSGDPEHEVFKKGGKWMCCKDMPNYFRDGMRRAQSLEALLLANRGQSLEGSVVVYPDKDSLSRNTELQRYLHTTQELEGWLDEAKLLRQKHLADGKDVYIHLTFSGKEPLRYGAGEKSCEVVVKSTSRKSNSYVCSFIHGRQISFTGDLEKALVFESEEAARAAIGNCWDKIKFVSLASQQKAYKPKPYLLQIGAGKLGGCYLSKTTKNTVYGSWTQDGAKKFASEKEATQFAQSLRDRGCDEARYGKFTLVNTDTNCRTVLAAI